MPANHDPNDEGEAGFEPAPPSRRRLSALRHHNYRLLWMGQVVSITGTWMQTVALAWLVLDLTDSAFDLSLVSVFQFGPMLILGLGGGLIADRFPKRTTLVVTQSIMLVLAALLATLVATDAIQLWHVYAIAFATGVASAADMPTRQSFVSELVPREDLMNAIALNSTLFNTGRVVGPAIAGGVLAFSGPALCFAINALSFFAVIFTMLRMRLTSSPKKVVGSNIARIREGLAYVRVTPAILLPMALVGFVGVFAMNFGVWIPLLAKQDLETGAGGYGLLMSTLGFGSLIGSLVMALFLNGPSRRIMIGSAIALGVFEIVLAIAGASNASTLMVLPLMAGMGYAMSTTNALANTTVQSAAPDAMRGRVMSVYMTVFTGTLPLGSLAAGILADAAGTPTSIAAGGAVALLAACAAGLLSRRVTQVPPLLQPTVTSRQTVTKVTIPTTSGGATMVSPDRLPPAR